VGTLKHNLPPLSVRLYLFFPSDPIGFFLFQFNFSNTPLESSGSRIAQRGPLSWGLPVFSRTRNFGLFPFVSFYSPLFFFSLSLWAAFALSPPLPALELRFPPLPRLPLERCLCLPFLIFFLCSDFYSFFSHHPSFLESLKSNPLSLWDLFSFPFSQLTLSPFHQMTTFSQSFQTGFVVRTLVRFACHYFVHLLPSGSRPGLSQFLEMEFGDLFLFPFHSSFFYPFCWFFECAGPVAALAPQKTEIPPEALFARIGNVLLCL